MEKRNQNYWLLGLLGCALFGIGDWLLGCVDPQPVSEVFSVLKTGHGEGYALGRITLTLVLGALGVPFMMAGCMRMAELVTETKRKGVLRWSMLLLPVGWLLIHFTVSCGIYTYAWNMQKGDPTLALHMAEDMTRLFRSSQLVADLMAGVPLILLVVFVLRGKTVLPKSSQFFTPLLWMAVFSALKFVIPASPLSNGIDTFCMNAGMMIWFGYLVVKMKCLYGKPRFFLPVGKRCLKSCSDWRRCNTLHPLMRALYLWMRTRKWYGRSGVHPPSASSCLAPFPLVRTRSVSNALT